MAVMDICSPLPTTRLCEAEREAWGIDAMVLFECVGVVVVLGDANRDGAPMGGQVSRLSEQDGHRHSDRADV